MSSLQSKSLTPRLFGLPSALPCGLGLVWLLPVLSCFGGWRWRMLLCAAGGLGASGELTIGVQGLVKQECKAEL